MKPATGYSHRYLYKRVVQAKLFIDMHYHEHIDLSSIAGEASFSKFHFIRLFKKIYHYTPHQYLTRVRIEEAKNRLGRGESVKDVCYTVGFGSASSFAGLFKRFTTVSPSAFQRKALTRRQQLASMPLLFVPGCFAEHRGWQKSNFEEVSPAK